MHANLTSFRTDELGLGAVLGFGIDRIKRLFDRRLARKQLLEELILNQRLLPHFRRYLESTIVALRQGAAPNMRTVHFARTSYDTNFSAVLPVLSQAERSSYHFIYEDLAICNEVSDEASLLLSSTGTRDELNRRIGIFVGTFESLRTTIDRVNELIDLHLKGTPRDASLPKKAEQPHAT